MVVVGVDPEMHGVGSVGGGLIGSNVGPFAHQGLDEAFGFTIHAGRIGPSSDVGEAGAGDPLANQVAAAGVAVDAGRPLRTVAHHPLDGDAEAEAAQHQAGGAIDRHRNHSFTAFLSMNNFYGFHS
jgi:hypothetical protein